MKNKYIYSVIGSFINYFFFGMAYIMIAQNMSFLSERLGTDNAGISFIISAFGFGRLVSLYLGGILSDKIGRKPFVILGATLMATFLIGIPLSLNYQIALIFAILGGVGNSLLDTGTNPSLMEAFPKQASKVMVLQKVFISIGSTLLPFLISFFIYSEVFFGWAFFIPAIVFLVNSLILLKVKFPHHKDEKELEENAPSVTFKSQPKFLVEGVPLIILGFTAPALLYIMNIWLPVFGQEVIGMSVVDSLKLYSLYSIGAVISVVVLSFIVGRWVRAINVILIYPILSLVSISGLILIKTPLVASIASFMLGVTLAGVLQLGLSILCEFFWDQKGRMTGVMYSATALATAIVPLITGFITRSYDIQGVFTFMIIINVIGILVSAVVNYRYRKLAHFNEEKQSIQLEKAI